MKAITIKLIFSFISLTALLSCSEEFLDVKRNQKILVPTSLDELQALLDNNTVMNNTPSSGMIASDDFYVTDVGFQSLDEFQQYAYTLKIRDMGQIGSIDWNYMYQQVFYANIVLEGLEKQNDRSRKYTELKGMALFYRAYSLFCLLQQFAPVYHKDNKDKMAIPLPLYADINKPRDIVNVEAAYRYVINQLLEAIEYLPSLQPVRSRPSNVAGYSLLGRLYLIMGEFKEAEFYAGKALELHSSLLDYSKLNINDTRPFPTPYPIGVGNPEIIYYSPLIGYSFFSSNNLEVRVDKELVKSYGMNDLRSALYFSTKDSVNYNFKGSYSGTRRGDFYSGLTVDENYLNYAEASLRNGRIDKAIEAINKLLKTRYKAGAYLDFESDSEPQTLNYILRERRKSLVGRGTRWFDIRRFANDEALFINSKRIVSNKTFEFRFGDIQMYFSYPINGN